MNTLTIFIFALLYTLSAGAQALKSGLDVNDVSFLFPLKNGLPYPDLNLQKDSIVMSSVFEEVLRFENKNTEIEDLPYTDSKFMTMDRWMVTAFRFETCGEVFKLQEVMDAVNNERMFLATQNSGCIPRLRLVAQPINFKHPLANGMHLVFKLTPSGAKKAMQDLIALKELASVHGIETTGLPLMVHPALRSESMGETSLMAKATKKTILSLIDEATLEIVTLSVRVTVNHWKFIGGYVKEDRWTRMVTEFSKQFNDGKNPKVLTGLEEIDCDNASVCKLSPTVIPAVLNPAGTVFNEIFQSKPEWQEQQVPGRRSLDVMIKAEKVDNPHKTNFFNTSCISCHQSSNLRDRTTLHTDLELPQGISPFVSKKFLDTKTNNVINFGYFGSIARISSRTAADSAVVANAINEELGLTNPAPAIKDLNKYWQCIVTESDFKICL